MNHTSFVFACVLLAASIATGAEQRQSAFGSGDSRRPVVAHAAPQLVHVAAGPSRGAESGAPTLAASMPPATRPASAAPADQAPRESGKHSPSPARPEPARNNVDLRYQPPGAPEPLDIANLLIRMTIGTVTVLGVGIVGVLTARRWLPQGVHGGRGEKMKLEESLALGKRCSVHLIAVEDHKLVVVMDGGSVKSAEMLKEPFPDLGDWKPEGAAVGPGAGSEGT